MTKIMWYKNITTVSLYHIKTRKNKILLQLDPTKSSYIYYNVRQYSLLYIQKPENKARLKYRSLCIYKTNYTLEHAHKYVRENNPIYNAELAEQFVDLIIEDLLQNCSFVLDFCPGNGHLIKALLDKNVPHVYTCEQESNLSPQLKELESKYSDRIHRYNSTFFMMSDYLSGRTMQSSQNMKEIMSSLPTGEWSDPASIQLVGVGSPHFFVSHVLLPTIFRSKLMMHSRPCFYIAVDPSLQQTLTADGSCFVFYRYASVMFQLFFNYYLFGTLHAPKIEAKVKTRAYYRIYGKQAKSGLHIMKLEPKPDLYNIVTSSQLFEFWYFLRILMIRRRNRILPIMENWVPGCGPSLIMQNVNMYTYVGDLTPQQLLDIFMNFQSWPQYKKTSVYANMRQVRGLCGLHDVN